MMRRGKTSSAELAGKSLSRYINSPGDRSDICGEAGGVWGKRARRRPKGEIVPEALYRSLLACRGEGLTTRFGAG